MERREADMAITEQTRTLTDVHNLTKQNAEGLQSQIRQMQSSLQGSQNEARQVSLQKTVLCSGWTRRTGHVADARSRHSNRQLPDKRKRTG